MLRVSISVMKAGQQHPGWKDRVSTGVRVDSIVPSPRRQIVSPPIPLRYEEETFALKGEMFTGSPEDHRMKVGEFDSEQSVKRKSSDMSQWMIVFITVFLYLSVVDCTFSVHRGIRLLNSSTSISSLKLPKHTPYPKVQDETTLKALVQGLGLTYEAHDVVTEDGYVLTLSRIGNPRRNVTHERDRGPPILMVNGLMMQSEAWLVQGNPRHNAALAWLEAGYDIWLGDQRGTLRSRKHIVYNESQDTFWDFTIHEVGVYDLPAFIDFILAATGYPKLVYVGLSLGTTFYFVMCSERPEFQNKIVGSILLMPIGVVPGYGKMSLETLLTMATVDRVMSLYLKYRAPFIKNLILIKEAMVFWCKAMTDDWIAVFGFTIGFGGKYQKKNFCYQIALSFGGTSVVTVLHTIQFFKTGKFQRYDYGIEENLKRYKQSFPPPYDLHRISTPTALYYSDIDVFAPAEEVEKLIENFSGPTYRCLMKGLTHIAEASDPRFRFYLKDLVEVADSMTGRSSSSRRKCAIVSNYL
ncbi:hypothetical protein GE061_003857 [Apolygus lucorum]|uniref:Partial AB-hydrolase lipase domain-containing protein n=1 Tax=Apolygus lucorum TaxID=248454 RepID=A0A8S9X086_APOLU|nr:hypothetical protein GE061_003857 [Apolygus lucorum]